MLHVRSVAPGPGAVVSSARLIHPGSSYSLGEKPRSTGGRRLESRDRSAGSHRPDHSLQLTVIALCVGLNMLDGFDVLAMSFAASGVKADWHLPDGQLGALLSAGLVGMGLGSLTLGFPCDQAGVDASSCWFQVALAGLGTLVPGVRAGLRPAAGPPSSHRGRHRRHRERRRHRVGIRAG